MLQHTVKTSIHRDTANIIVSDRMLQHTVKTSPDKTVAVFTDNNRAFMTH